MSCGNRRSRAPSSQLRIRPRLRPKKAPARRATLQPTDSLVRMDRLSVQSMKPVVFLAAILVLSAVASAQDQTTFVRTYKAGETSSYTVTTEDHMFSSSNGTLTVDIDLTVKKVLDGGRAEILRQKSREQLGDVLDLCLLEKEIQTKRQEIAKAKLEAALNDVRVLLLVRSFESAQSVLEAVAELVVYADDGLVRQFDAFLEAARTGAAQRHAQQSVSDLESTQIVDLDDQTQLADLGQLEAMLGEVTVVAGHYPDDTKVQTAIEDIRNKITSRITVIRRA